MQKYTFLLFILICCKIAGSYHYEDRACMLPTEEQISCIVQQKEDYARDVTSFKKTVNSYGNDLNIKQISEIVDSGYPCKCKNELVKCHQWRTFELSNPFYKIGMLDVLIERKPDIVRKYKHELFDSIITDPFSYYCMMRALTPYLNLYESADAQYYITSIINASDKAKVTWTYTSSLQPQMCEPTEAQKHGLLVWDKCLSTYLFILIENNINTAFFKTQNGKEKVKSLNEKYFTQLKQILENQIQHAKDKNAEI